VSWQIRSRKSVAATRDIEKEKTPSFHGSHFTSAESHPARSQGDRFPAESNGFVTFAIRCSRLSGSLHFNSGHRADGSSAASVAGA
jgi:hypothetical protein